MKSLRFLLPLLAALLVSVGFFLPWMGAAWQDRRWATPQCSMKPPPCTWQTS